MIKEVKLDSAEAVLLVYWPYPVAETSNYSPDSPVPYLVDA